MIEQNFMNTAAMSPGRRARICLFALSGILTLQAAGRRAGFDNDWRFLKGDPPGAEQPAFDDAAWRKLDLPHDWAIEGPFDSALNPNTGGLPISGIAWYRKHFTIPTAAKENYYTIEFDGAMSNSKVWLNGVELGGRPYGYSSFALDLTPHLRPGQENVIAVRLAPEENSSRWYPGAGLYRNVWLTTTGPVHVDHWGTYVTTPEVSTSAATVSFRADIRNRRPRGRPSIRQHHGVAR